MKPDAAASTWSCLLVAAALVAACDPGDGSNDDDMPAAAGKADAPDGPGADSLDLVAWAAARPSAGSVVGDWARARLHGDAGAYDAAYADDATLTIVDGALLASDASSIADHFEAERDCFVAHRIEHLWAFDDPSQGVTAVVERLSGTLADDLDGCPLLAGADPDHAAGVFVSVHRLAVLRTSLSARGRVIAEILAYDESTIPGQIAGSAEVRDPDARTDFGPAVVHEATAGQRAIALRSTAQAFDAAFGRADVEGTAAFLDDDACAGPCVTDFTFAVDFDKASFGGLLGGFFGAFTNIAVNQGDGHGRHDDRVHIVGVSASDEWVLDAFQWSATGPTGKPVLLTDYVLLQFRGDAIARSITFKNGAALGRQIAGS